MDIHGICFELAHDLCAVHHASEDRAYLILPIKRDGSTRFSEQESKILLSQVCERRGLYYSIETPTRETYIQSGTTALSARIDITVYAQPDQTSRNLNIELKAGNPPIESFRKDLEKLIREKLNGLWFHTLVSASEMTWQGIFDKVRESFRLIDKHAVSANHKLDFAFCVINTQQLYVAEITLGPQVSDEAQRVFGENVFSWRRIDLIRGRTSTVKVNLLRSHKLASSESTRQSYPLHKRTKQSHPLPKRGKELKSLVYCPEIASDSFIHLSTQGDRYALRSYVGSLGRKRFKIPGVLTTSALRSKYHIIHELNVTFERVNLDKQPDYWEKRIYEMNIKYDLS